MLQTFNRFERGIYTIILVLLIVMIALSVVSLVYAMLVTILSPPILLLTSAELLDIFGEFMLVLLALEFFESIRIFLRDNMIKFEPVIVIAITAISRKIILLDYNAIDGLHLIGLGVLVLSLSAGYYLLRRANTGDGGDRTINSMTVRRLLGHVAALAALLLLAVHAAAAPAGPPVPFAPPGLSEAEAKVSTDLLALADDRFLLPNQSRGEVVSALARSGHYAKAGQVHRALGTTPVELVEVYVRTDPGTGAAALRPFLHRVSAEDAAAGLVAGWVAPGRILDLAEVPSVREVRPVIRPSVRTGSISSAGDVLLRAAELRNATGLSGAGIRVGVISDGVDHWTSARATGDLPADLAVLRNEVGGDEGTAMLEIVHDIAPNASLVFHDCGWNVLEFNQAIDALADAGCRVIVDDIGWTDEPFFEDGVVATHAAEAVSNRGVVYVSAAGNDAGLHYQGLFRDDGQDRHDGQASHNFSSSASSSGNRLYVDLPPGDSVTVVLEWSEPFGLAASNYDLALYDTADGSIPLAAGSRVQDGNDDPIEVLTWVNAGTASVQAEVDVSKPTSAPARILELFVYPHGGASLLPVNTNPDDSVYGHPAANGVMAVAAIDSTDLTGGRIEPYSSRGPVTIIAPQAATRQKPDCSGVDGVRVTGAGSFPTGFWGTSAAAPHAAGLAALLWSGRQDAPGEQVRSALLATADDLGPSSGPIRITVRAASTRRRCTLSSRRRRGSRRPCRAESRPRTTIPAVKAWRTTTLRSRTSAASTGRPRASTSNPSSAYRGTTSAGFGRASGCGTP